MVIFYLSSIKPVLCKSFNKSLFIAVSAFAIWLFAKNIGIIRRNIFLGKDEDLSDNPSQRWKNLLLLAFGQKKMFRNPLVAVMHFIVYAGFIIINLEVLEIVLDGMLGTHRLFLPYIGSLYCFLINSFEILAAGVLIACVIFLIRRNIIKLKRFISKDLAWMAAQRCQLYFNNRDCFNDACSSP